MKVTSVADTAVDLSGMGKHAHEYMRTRNPELLKTVPGEKPTIFTLQLIDSNTFLNTVQGAPSEGERYRRAFAFGVSQITDLVMMDGTERKIMEPDQQIMSPMSGAVRYWADQDLAMIPPVFIEDIGHFCFMRSYCSPKAKASFQPPRTVVSVFLGRLALDAAERAKELRSLKSAALQAETTPTSPESGGGDTAAAATE